MPQEKKPHQRKRKHYSISPSPPPAHAQGRTFQTIQQQQGRREINSESHNDAWQPEIPSTSGPSYMQQTPATLPSPVLRTGAGTDLHATTPVQIPQEVSNTHHTPSDESYLGRSEYLGGSVPFNEGMTTGALTSKTTGLSEVDLQVLHLLKAFDLPPRATRESLIDKYMQLCSPWMPIVEWSWLEEADGEQPSLLLLQAVFLAGSRVTSDTLVHASSREFYRRARALFFSGYEKNIIFSIVALCLLQWWNPTGPEQISTDTSGFWVRIAVGMAYQAGLHREQPQLSEKDQTYRRRLWWTLVCRDSVISVGLGRPRTINLEDSDVSPPSIEDFPNPDLKAHLFVNFVSICQLLGDVAQCYRRKWLSPRRRKDLENALFRWVKELHPEFYIFQKGPKRHNCPSNFEARQIFVPYFVILVILHRGPVAGSVPSPVSLIASSFITTIYEEFIARDELRHLGPAFTFYALAAGLSQLSGYRYMSLASAVEENFKVIQMSLQLLAKRWGSANGALRALSEARKAVLRLPRYREPPASIPANSRLFFSDFDPSFCNMGHLLNNTANTSNPPTENIDQFVNTTTVSIRTDFQLSEQQHVAQTAQPPEIGLLEEGAQNPIPAPPSMFPLYMDGGYGHQQQESLWAPADPVGSWLLDDFNNQWTEG
ncbi:hypothetical protein B7463_g7059, partial [Scytalidium lignicola]